MPRGAPPRPPPVGLSVRQAVNLATEAIEDAFNAKHAGPPVRLWSWVVLGELARGTHIAVTGPPLLVRSVVTALLSLGAERAGAPFPWVVAVEDERHAVDLATRMMARDAELATTTLRTAALRRPDWLPLANAAGTASGLPVSFVWTGDDDLEDNVDGDVDGDVDEGGPWDGAVFLDLRAPAVATSHRRAAAPSPRPGAVFITVCAQPDTLPRGCDLHLDVEAHGRVVVHDARHEPATTTALRFDGTRLRVDPARHGAQQAEAALEEEEIWRELSTERLRHAERLAAETRAAESQLPLPRVFDVQAGGETGASADLLHTRPPSGPEQR